MEHVAHSVWKHDIDSEGSGEGDEGDLCILPNGDCTEFGMSKNPESGKVEMYKEYWTSPPPGSDEQLKIKPCVVAEIVRDDDFGGPECRGLAIRVGDYCQGILGRGTPGDTSVFKIERWTKSSIDGNWEGDQRNGKVTAAQSELPTSPSTWIPCIWLCEEYRALGDEIRHGHTHWKVTEILK